MEGGFTHPFLVVARGAWHLEGRGFRRSRGPGCGNKAGKKGRGEGSEASPEGSQRSVRALRIMLTIPAYMNDPPPVPARLTNLASREGVQGGVQCVQTFLGAPLRRLVAGVRSGAWRNWRTPNAPYPSGGPSAVTPS